jgi:hypothetical protein
MEWAMPDLHLIKQAEQGWILSRPGSAMTARFADGKPPDFANAAFAELFGWSLASPARGLI